MRRPVVGRRPPSRFPGAAGFTLIELLMVVVLIGIIAGVVIFYIDPNSPQRAVETETDRLLTTLSLAEDEATAENEELGLRIHDNSYDFLVYDENSGTWQPFDVDAAYRPHPMPDGLYIHLVTETRGHLPAANADTGNTTEKNKATAIEPDILLLSSGETTDAIIEVGASDRPSINERVLIDDIGNLKREVDGGS